MKKGEKIYRIKAEWTTRCKECGAYIPVGGTFLLDLIPYWHASTWGPSFKKTWKHILCENCWRGPRNIIIDLTKRSRPEWKHNRYLKKPQSRV